MRMKIYLGMFPFNGEVYPFYAEMYCCSEFCGSNVTMNFLKKPKSKDDDDFSIFEKTPYTWIEDGEVLDNEFKDGFLPISVHSLKLSDILLKDIFGVSSLYNENKRGRKKRKTILIN